MLLETCEKSSKKNDSLKISNNLINFSLEILIP